MLLFISLQITAKIFEKQTEYTTLKLDIQGIEKVTDTFYVSWINSTPRMPKLSAIILPNNLQGNIKWKLTIEYRRDNRNDCTIFEKELPIAKSWDIYNEFSNEFYGGKATLTWEYVSKCPEKSFIFHIRGVNPSESDAEAAIGTNPWYAKAIARHESGIQNGRTYIHFNEIGSYGPEWTDIRYCPNWGAPHGWGMMMFDNPAPTRNELWNWRAMVSAALVRMAGHRTEAQEFFDAVKRTFSDKWVEPPSSYTVSGTSTAITPIDAAAIQCYNGCAVVYRLWTGQYDKHGNKIKRAYRSCWAFNQNNPADTRWQFIDNQNNYVKEIIKEYEKKG